MIPSLEKKTSHYTALEFQQNGYMDTGYQSNGLRNRIKKNNTTTNAMTRLRSFYPVVTGNQRTHHSLLFFFSTLSNSARLMRGSTPPNAMVARISVSSSSSPRMASCRWRGVIRLTLRSLAALPANSRTSAVRYSRTAVV